MDFSTSQYFALLASVICMAIVIGLAYTAGLKHGHAAGQRIGDLTRDALRKQLDKIREHLNSTDRVQALTKQRYELIVEQINEELTAVTATLTKRDIQLDRMQRYSKRVRHEVEVLTPRALTEDDAHQLAAIAAKLDLAASLFTNLNAADQGTSARLLSVRASNLAQRYWASTPAQAPMVKAA